ncbi:hypothetical protein DPMN_114927 [Dreissena polymorpha]|uniref:Uncharacterized protein n=1 Tax=Dreissena polymorpha TaxID=45954 RepID=A0A9D4KKD2_DREPO|nr:hypothetical protein DPMN_114927 [Dreissena polymorpha]
MTLHPGDSCVNNWMLKAMAKDAGFLKHKRITNHSVHKFLVQKLRNANIPPTETMAITGHKNMSPGRMNDLYLLMMMDQYGNNFMMIPETLEYVSSPINTW